VAAQEPGPEGTVTVYEGSAKHVSVVRNTLELNDVSDRVIAEHGIVGAEIDLQGSPAGPGLSTPPTCPTVTSSS